MKEPILINAVTLDCRDPKALSEFYMKFLQWEKAYEDDTFVVIHTPASSVEIIFQKNTEHIPPVWPEAPNSQQQQAHLDFKAGSKEEMEAMVEYAVSCGAKKAEKQYSQSWTVMIDPAGHPFCLSSL